MGTNVYAKFRCAALRIKKALRIFRELIPTRTTRVTFWDPPSGSKNFMESLSLSWLNMTCETWHCILIYTNINAKNNDDTAYLLMVNV